MRPPPAGSGAASARGCQTPGGRKTAASSPAPPAPRAAPCSGRPRPRWRGAPPPAPRTPAPLARATGPARSALLGRAAALLAGRPDAADAYLDTLRELIELEPDERSHAVAAERVLTRLGRHAELDELLAKLEARVASGAERGRLR